MKLENIRYVLVRITFILLLILIAACSSNTVDSVEEIAENMEMTDSIDSTFAERDVRPEPISSDTYIAVSKNGSDDNDGKLVVHGGTGPMATIQAAVLACSNGDTVYLYDDNGNTEFVLEDIGISFVGVENNIHFSSWPGQFHKITANNLPGNLDGTQPGLPGAMGLFEFGPGTDIDRITFSHFEAEALLNVWAFLDNTNSSGTAMNGEIFNVIARCTADSETAGAPLTQNSRWDSNAAIVHFEENEKQNPVNDGWEIHHSIFEHSLPLDEQSINSGGVYTIGQRNINVHHMLFRNINAGMFYKWASSGEPVIKVGFSVFENVAQPLKGTARGVVVHDNLFVGGIWNTIIVGDDANATGGENVLIEKNTFVGPGFYFEARGSTFNNFVVRNNIFNGTDYSSSLFTTEGGDPSLTQSAIVENNIFEKLIADVFPESDPSTAEQNSFGVLAQFTGASTNPVVPSDYVLIEGSPGKGQGENGADLGADLTKVTGWMWQ